MQPKNGVPLFDEAEHRYTWNGKTPPGVTSILQSVNPVRYAHNPKLLERGKYFHRLCHAVANNTFDFASDKLDGEEIGIAAAYSFFLSTMGLGNEVPMIEQPLVSRTGYAGTPDQVFFQNKVLVDLKFGVKQKKPHTHQLVAYFNLLLENYPDLVKRSEWKLIAVYPKDNSTFKSMTVKFTPTNLSKWNAYLIVYKDKEG